MALEIFLFSCVYRALVVSYPCLQAEGSNVSLRLTEIYLVVSQSVRVNCDNNSKYSKISCNHSIPSLSLAYLSYHFDSVIS